MTWEYPLENPFRSTIQTYHIVSIDGAEPALICRMSVYAMAADLHFDDRMVTVDAETAVFEPAIFPNWPGQGWRITTNVRPPGPNRFH